jgi:hypothetical protein
MVIFLAMAVAIFGPSVGLVFLNQTHPILACVLFVLYLVVGIPAICVALDELE